MIHLLILALSVPASAADLTMTSNGKHQVCEGVFRDDGGLESYSNQQSVEHTICGVDGGSVQAIFKAFETEMALDVMWAMDGIGPFLWAAGHPVSSTSIPSAPAGQILFNGGKGWHGKVAPGTLTSTTGCLTFYFLSDGGANRQGWEAELSCVQPPAK